MTKKVLIIFACILLAFGITEVQAFSETDKVTPETKVLDTLFQQKVSNKWQDLIVKRYTSDELNIYKIGVEKNGSGTISVFGNRSDDRILRIIKEGHKIEEVKQIDTDDAYMAFKIAIDCVINKYNTKNDDEKNYMNYYQVLENLTVEQSQRAEKILNVVGKLIELANDESITYGERVTLKKVGEFATDESDKNYYCQYYTFYIQGRKLNSYEISINCEENIKCKSEMLEIKETEEALEMSEYTFKIMVQKENKEGPIKITTDFAYSYSADRMFTGTDSGYTYIIHSINTIYNSKEMDLIIQELKLDEVNEEEDTSEATGGDTKGATGGLAEVENTGNTGGEIEENTDEKEEIKGEKTDEALKTEEEDKTKNEETSNEETDVGKREEETGTDKNEEDTGEKKEEIGKENLENTDSENKINNDKEQTKEKDKVDNPNKEDFTDDDQGKKDEINKLSEEDKPQESGNVHSQEENKEINREDNIKQNTQETDTNREIKQEEIIQKTEDQKENYLTQNMVTLPRTGRDYFIIKLVLVDLILFIIYTVFILKKKQTVS